MKEEAESRYEEGMDGLMSGRKGKMDQKGRQRYRNPKTSTFFSRGEGTDKRKEFGSRGGEELSERI